MSMQLLLCRSWSSCSRTCSTSECNSRFWNSQPGTCVSAAKVLTSDVTVAEQPLFKCLITVWKERGFIFFFVFCHQSFSYLPLTQSWRVGTQIKVLRSPVCLTPNSVAWIRGPNDAVNKHLPLIGLLGAG